MFILLAQTYHAVMHQVMEGAALANIYIGVRKESWLRSGGVKLRTHKGLRGGSRLATKIFQIMLLNEAETSTELN